jgi:hypothetical protein
MRQRQRTEKFDLGSLGTIVKRTQWTERCLAESTDPLQYEVSVVRESLEESDHGIDILGTARCSALYGRDSDR